MSFTIAPRCTSALAEATRIAPRRRTSSDGTLGDAAHRAEHSDHNPEDDPAPGFALVVHAFDISQSTPGSPYWQPFYAVFDTHAYQRKIAAAYVAASTTVRSQRWPWLFDGGYMVSFDGTKDTIFNPSVSLTWRQNGAFKTEHANHGHFSIGHTLRAEQDTQPIFGAAPAQEDDVTEAEMDRIVTKVVQKLGRQPDGTPGLIGDEVAHVLGGYVDGKWVDGQLAAVLRNERHLSK